MWKEISQFFSMGQYLVTAVVIVIAIIFVFSGLYDTHFKSKIKLTPGKLFFEIFLCFLFFNFVYQFFSDVDYRLLAPWNIESDKSFLTITYTKTGIESGFLRNMIESYSYNSNIDIIASAVCDGSINFWSTENGKLQKKIPKAGCPVAMDISRDGKYILTSGYDNRINILTTSDYTIVKTSDKPAKGSIDYLHFSPDQKIFVSACRDLNRKPIITIWSIDELQPITSFEGSIGLFGIRSDSFSPDSKLLAFKSGVDDNRIKIWSITKNQIVNILGDANHYSYSFCFSPDSSMIAMTGFQSGTIELWSTYIGTKTKTIKTSARGVRISALRFSPDGKTIAWGGQGSSRDNLDTINPVKLISLDTGKTIKSFGGRINWVDYIDFSSDGKIIVAAGEETTRFHDTDQRLIKLWNVDS